MSENEENQLSFDLKARTQAEISKPPTDTGGDKADDILQWVCHPAKKNIRITVLVTIFLIVLVAIVYYMTYSVWFALLGAVILFGSLATFYFPTRYILSADKIIIKTNARTQEKTWAQYRSFYPDKNGVLLSPFVRPSRLENFRGVYIKFWYNKDKVVAFVERQIKAHREREEEAV
jgi:hypothetical protein